MPLPILSVAEMRDWENATWAAGQTEEEVIRRVGLALANCALQLTRDGDSILLLAGKGHNGDDARAAAPHLARRDATLLNITDPAAQLGEVQAALAQQPNLVVDALFGIGLNRPLDEHWQRFIETLNAAQLPVLAVDVPSGLNADTGESHGAAVIADCTVTVGAPKQGLLRPKAWDFAGRIEVITDVGLVPCPLKSDLQWTCPGDFKDFPPRRATATHKGDFGHLAIGAGSLGYHGAAVLATRAAQRAHVGLVTLQTLGDVYHAVASQTQGVMVRVWNESAQFNSPHTAILVGPGLAAPEAAAEFSKSIRRLWRDEPKPVIVDASALDWLPLDPVPKGAIRVITPHPGEAARMLRNSTAYVQADRPRAVRELSTRYANCWVVLKGQNTLIGRISGEVFVNSSGNPLLAQGGSGDILAGYIAGLLAQPALQRDAAHTLRYAVWQHGATADALTREKPNWIVEDLAEALGSVRPPRPVHP